MSINAHVSPITQVRIDKNNSVISGAEDGVISYWSLSKYARIFTTKVYSYLVFILNRLVAIMGGTFNNVTGNLEIPNYIELTHMIFEVELAIPMKRLFRMGSDIFSSAKRKAIYRSESYLYSRYKNYQKSCFKY